MLFGVGYFRSQVMSSTYTARVPGLPARSSSIATPPAREW